MAADAQSIARAFAPFAAIEEFQNVVQLHSKKNPLFLRRNLSYSATHQARTERDQKATSVLHLHLEPLNAPPGYSNSITVVAAVCAVLPGDDALMVPLFAKVARVGLRPTSQLTSTGNGTSQGGKSLGVTLSMKVRFAQGILPKDIVVVLLHKRDRSISRIVRHVTKAKHRGADWNAAGREVTCTIKDNHVFQWYKSDTNVLYATVHPSEEMMEIPPPTAGKNKNHPGFSPIGASNPIVFSQAANTNTGTTPSNTTEGGVHSKRGTIELQPGIIQTHDPFQEDGDTFPSSFYFKNGPIGDATPMLRYLLTLEGIPAVRKRKRDSLGGISSPPPTINGGGSSSLPKQLLNKLHPQPLSVNFCSFDGSIKISTKLQHGYSCPFESCGLRCRGSVGALHQHLVASHPYYEYFITKSDDHGAELWVRCRKEWFGGNGVFLPASPGVAKLTLTINNIINNTAALPPPPHPLAMLLHKTATSLPFQYFCREKQQRYRNNEGGNYPIDAQEDRIEQHAALMMETAAEAAIAAGVGGGAVVNPSGMFAWETADLTPDIEEGRTELNSEFEDSGGNTTRKGGNASARPPRPPNGRQRIGNLAHLSRQQSLIPSKLPLTAKNGLPKFYHRGRCIAMTEKELEIEAADSDDDTDTEQYIRYCSTALEEKPNLCKEEMDFMLKWNLYIHNNPIHADSAVPDVCIAFANEHKEMLKDASGWFRRCFAAHVLNLWKFRLLTPAQMHAALVAAGGGEGGGEGGGGDCNSGKGSVGQDFSGANSGFLSWQSPDLQVELEGIVYPCHAHVLGYQSKVLADMFASDPDPSNWVTGVTTAFAENKAAGVKLYLMVTYSTQGSFAQEMCSTSSGISATIEAMELAHKLNSKLVKLVCTEICIKSVALFRTMDRVLLTNAISCGGQRLQSIVLTELLMEIIDISRKNQGPWRSTVSQKLEKLLNLDLEAEMKRRLNKAVIELVIYGVVGTSVTVFPGLGRAQIEDIMR